jgi:two-component system, NtrC family, response regulator HydG
MSLETGHAHAELGLGLKEMLDQYERSLIQQALAASGGNQRRAARVLGVLPTTLHEKMKRLGLRSRLLPGPAGESAGGPPSAAAEVAAVARG